MPDRRSSSGWRATVVPSSACLTARPAAMSAGRSSGDHAQPEARGRDRGVDRAAVGHVDRDARGLARRGRRRTTARCGRRRLDAPAAHAHARDDAAGGDVDRHVDLAVARRGHRPRLDGPRAERDRPVPARGRVAVLVPEEDAEVGAVVVGRHQEAAVHVGVPARLVAQQPADRVDGLGRGRALAALAHRGAGDRRDARRHDPERLARRVVVRRRDLGRYRVTHASGSSASLATRAGRRPAATSASVTRSTTLRRLARTAIHTCCSGSAAPW